MFSEKLLEAKGFENHYLVQHLGQFSIASLKGRIPAISKKRVGMVDVPLRKFKDIVENVQQLENIDDSAFAVIDWNIGATISEAGEKSSFAFHLDSTFHNIQDGDSSAREGNVIVSLSEMEFFLEPNFYDVDKDIEDEESYEEWKQHPLFCFFEEIHLEILKSREFVYNGLNVSGDGNRGNATYHYSRTVGDKTEYMTLNCDLEALEAELEEIMD